MCAEAGPEGGEACSVKVRQTNPKKCPVCRTALARNPIRALSAEQGIAVLPATCTHFFTASTRGELLGHEARCPRAPARCVAGADGCRWEGHAGEREAHEAMCVWGRATPPPILNRSNQCTPSLN
jgi:predicted alpha/beta hydrolase